MSSFRIIFVIVSGSSMSMSISLSISMCIRVMIGSLLNRLMIRFGLLLSTITLSMFNMVVTIIIIIDYQ